MLVGDIYNGLVMLYVWRALSLRNGVKTLGIGAARFHASGGTDLLQRAGSLFGTDVFLDYSRTTTDEPHRVSGL